MIAKFIAGTVLAISLASVGVGVARADDPTQPGVLPTPGPCQPGVIGCNPPPPGPCQPGVLGCNGNS